MAVRVGSRQKESQGHATVYNIRLIIEASKSVLTDRILVGRLVLSLMPARGRSEKDGKTPPYTLPENISPVLGFAYHFRIKASNGMTVT